MGGLGNVGVNEFPVHIWAFGFLVGAVVVVGVALGLTSLLMRAARGKGFNGEKGNN